MPSASSAPTLPFLERLLDGEKVEWKTLGEVCDIVKATSKLKSGDYCVSGKVPIIDQGAQYIAGYTDKELTTIPKDEYIIFGDHTETIKFVDFEFVQGADGLKILHTKKALSKYVYYAFSNFYKKTASYKRHWSKAKETAIPLPPLRVQARIVEILDKFTQLEAELEAELEARNKQYDFYRNRLLDFAHRDDFDGKVEWKTLGEICEKVCSGGTPLTSHSKYYEGNIPWLRTQDIDWQEIHDTEIKITEEAIANSSAKLIPENCVIVAMYGATAAKACINKIPLTTNQACCNLQIDEKQAHYKYAYYWICNEYERLRAQGEGSQSNLNAKKIKSYPIPLPPLSEQRRIVEILDRFDTLTNSISEGLPREITLRRKQYEYYRDALLRFPQPAPTA